MRKIGCTIIVLLCILAGKAIAQDVSFTATAPKVVAAGQQFEISYTLNQQPAAFRPPSFSDKGIDLIMGPSVNTQFSMSNIQGQVRQEAIYSYSYYVRCNSEGTYALPGATCQVNGKNYQSNSISFRVEKGAAPPSQPQARQQQPSMRQQNAAPSADDQIDESNAFFIRAVASKSNPVQGEQVIVTYKLYTLVPIQQYQISKLPANKGFWAEELDEKNQKLTQYYENYNGQKYSVAEIRKVAFFAQESGNLTIAPLDVKIRARVQVRRQQTGSIFDMFDDPFFGGSQTIERDLKSNSVNINVSPLPSTPEGFNGAVGNFVIKSEVDNNTVKANEAISYKITISGKGNVMLIDQPKVNFPQGFEIYDPKISTNINRNEAGVSGSKTFEWVLIPRTKGNYTIPPIKFVYYDAATKKFNTQQGEQHDIVVEKGDGSAGVVMTGSNKEEIKLLNSDIEYIKTGAVKLHAKNSYFFKSGLYWLLICLPVLLLIAGVFVFRYLQKSKSDVLAVRLRMANSIAKKRLQRAEKFHQQKDENQFYIEVSQALWGYLSDKFGISTAKLSIDAVQEALEKENIAQDTITQVVDTINHCEFARFAPGDSAKQMDAIYKEAIISIISLENSLKK